MQQPFSVTLRSSLEEVGRLLDGLRAWGRGCALEERVLFQVSLVLEELLTNVIKHGYGAAQEGPVEVRVARNGDALEISMRDRGRPFDPFQAATPRLDAELEARTIGGLGIHFVRLIASRHAYRRDGDANQVDLVIPLKGAPSP